MDSGGLFLQPVKRFVAMLVLGSIAAWLLVVIAAVGLLVTTARDFEGSFIAACTMGVMALLVAVIFSGAGALRIAPTREAILSGNAGRDKDRAPVDPRSPWGGAALFWALLLITVQLGAAVFLISA